MRYEVVKYAFVEAINLISICIINQFKWIILYFIQQCHSLNLLSIQSCTFVWFSNTSLLQIKFIMLWFTSNLVGLVHGLKRFNQDFLKISMGKIIGIFFPESTQWQCCTLLELNGHYSLSHIRWKSHAIRLCFVCRCYAGGSWQTEPALQCGFSGSVSAKRIAEAILYMQDNLNTFNNKVSAHFKPVWKKDLMG